MDEFFDKEKALEIILDIAYKKNISQAKLIEGIYDYSHFNRMCNGKENIKIDVLVLCCLKLEISFDDLVQKCRTIDLIEIDKYYDKFETIRIRRNYNELMPLYRKISSEQNLYKLNKYKQITNHILGIVEAQVNCNFERALDLLENAFNVSGCKMSDYAYHGLDREQIEILIDYSICCFLLGDTRWKRKMDFLMNKNNNYTTKRTLYYVYSKISYNISIMYLIQKEYINALRYAEIGIDFSKKTNNYIFIGYLYYNKACCLAMLDDITGVIENLDISRSIFIIQNKESEFNEVYLNDCSTYFAKIV